MAEPGAVADASTPTAAESWLALLEKRPHPYTTPVPDGGATVLDGIHVKVEPKDGTVVPCRRCPDYLPEGGIWRLSLDGGVFGTHHEATRWQSLASFAVHGERFYLSNEPTVFPTGRGCMGGRGWRVVWIRRRSRTGVRGPAGEEFFGYGVAILSAAFD